MNSLVLAVGATVFLVLTAKAKVSKNVAKLGSEYSTYMRESKRFIPSL